MTSTSGEPVLAKDGTTVTKFVLGSTSSIIKRFKDK
jgi:hypothetical protein